jgi:hypothetical protein
MMLHDELAHVIYEQPMQQEEKQNKEEGGEGGGGGQGNASILCLFFQMKRI